MNRKPRAGLLPLYLKLYDDRMADRRKPLEEFLERLAGDLSAQGVEVVRAPICRLAEEFDKAVAELEAADVDILISLHLAYSPSLESVGALARTSLPLLILDTTMDYDFGPAVDPARIMYNHGIHGVQDLASVLRRRERPYRIVAGYFAESDVLCRAAEAARGAYAARLFARTRALRIGETFKGMGDFAVADEAMGRLLGIDVAQVDADALIPAVREVTDEMIDQEMADDRRRFDGQIDQAVHRRSVRVGLGLRKYLASGGYSAFSVNFLAFDSAEEPVDNMPFLEISKAMERGIGYAGEGDVLTASLVGALGGAFAPATFTEIFCPDWKGDSLFLSHMGEINPAVAGDRPVLCEKDFPFTGAKNPAFIACAPAPGSAVLVNLAPGPRESFGLIVAPVEVLGDGAHPAMQETVRGWIRPACGTAEFLEEYSRWGGTHHSALVMGDRAEGVEAFAAFAGLECHLIS